MSGSFSNYELHDFINNESFVNWVQHPSAEEETFWQQFQLDHPEKREIINTARRLVDAVKINEVALPENEVEQLWSTIRSASNLETKVRRLWIRWAAAAILTGISIAGGAYYYYLNSRVLIQSAMGMVKQVTLPDGSLVTLNANSKISYERNWSKHPEREVWVEGEVFFNVVHLNKNEKQIKNEERFIVHTGDMNIEVLGTTFNVNTRRGETKVSLNTGKIKVDLKAVAKKSVIMKPGDVVEFSKRNQVYKHSQTNTQKLSLWTSKQLLFENTTMLEVATIIEETYGAKVVFKEEELKRRTLTGTVSCSSEDVLLNAISASLQIKIEKSADDKEIIISNQ
ncbi:FecR domain-containing protein [Solitalea sp. MAHUQ-68]|uniref:FecR domain-containing protein n=1 Tax=Solitalea agri TaxID=2953739 RepID=A0A9X2JBF9_9SPHI|nr:FecR domain-containing protein [Solitalea agri]MCO4292447.1 FecR domain-containing protein [Solitalea agri]